MKRIFQLIALMLIFFLLAFSLAFVRITPTEGDLSITLGGRSLYIPQKVLWVIGDSFHAIESVMDALPAHIALGFDRLSEAAEEVSEVFRLLLSHGKEINEGVVEVSAFPQS